MYSLSAFLQCLYMYRIKKGEAFDQQHLAAIKLYTDFTKICAVLCAILRRGDPVEVAQVAHWTRLLIETVQCYGSSLKEENAKKTYYRGVNRTFMFMKIVSRFNLPQSTTSSVEYLSIRNCTRTVFGSGAMMMTHLTAFFNIYCFPETQSC